MINLNSNISSVTSASGLNITPNAPGNVKNNNFSNAVKAAEKYLGNVDSAQNDSETAIKDMLTGKNGDVNTVVASVARADISFKLLVGVRNKLIEAYKQTINMQI